MPDLHDLQPDPLSPRPEEVERYVAALQELAKRNPIQARRHAWDQIRLAGARATGPTRDEAHESLERMFRLGIPPEPPLDGPFRGVLVTPLTTKGADPLLRSAMRLWTPWVGKRFDASREQGDNLLSRSALVPMRILWPAYRPDEPDARHLVTFRFRTSRAPQALELDYDLPENPSLLVRDIVDEVVQVVPGAYLGRILLRRGADRRPIGWFALEPPEAVRLEQPAAAAETGGSPVPLPA